ncbi:mono-functional DNA-alkylating methyl methanesulfonate N-term-domain-containing protein [Gilbertella persicaria]|uniref:mono-functional DNA-alkylating methyl methanesulfonate N-term-domain-containing protein n=1 Tax=Gilbertella persicaria TaxID=101096 RepID=UPI00221E84D6|nr:mono-functional DNA-alkylating methyl methanesulfonate N-term-domain-containing protein [Gilbertella persicaria]KAI8072256.1 mono-functional DNA-alkylating methyl methanesulfonate N-term-domain-containing protein [Gilbertella persicaria]
MDYEDVTYAKRVRQHSTIEGQDIIVALSEYGKLVFMTIIADLDQNIKRFETVSEDTFDIFIMSKSMSRIYFDPIIGRGSEIEEGIIWHMEFLHTETDTMDRILLVLVIYNDVERLCRLVIYAIDASDPQHVIIDKVSRLPLEKNTPLPLLLIPLKFQPESFMLVTEQQVCLLTADDLACGNVLYPTSIIPRQFGSIESEGCLFKLEINVTGELVWHPIESASPIGQSMCMLGTIDMLGQKNDQVTADIVLCAGESADSLVLAIPHEQSDSIIRHITIQTLINRAPLTDVQVADNYRDHQDALIACSGQDEHGALSIVTSGIETTMLSSSDKAEWKGVSGSWSIMQNSTRPLYLVTSSMLDTRLLSAKGI